MSPENIEQAAAEWKVPEKEAKEPPQPSANKTPIKPGEEFYPEEEIKQIRQGPKEGQKKKLEEFKEKLTYQKEGLAWIQTQIIEKTHQDPDVSIKTLAEWIRDEGARYGMNKEQKNTAADLLELYGEKRAVIQTLRREFPDNGELYQAVFGTLPVGKVDVVEGPMTLYLRCFDLEDYARALQQKWEPGQTVTEPDRKRASLSAGFSLSAYPRIPELAGTIIVENAADREGKPLDIQTYKHEEQHAIKRIFGERIRKREVALRLKQPETESERLTALRAYLRQHREEVSDERIRSEILAYLKQGDNAEDIKNVILEPVEEGGIYDFRSDQKELLIDWYTSDFGKDKAQEMETAFEEVFVKEHEKLVKTGVDAAHNLKKHGYTTDEVIALLIHEPLARWEKVGKRLLAAHSRQ